MEPAKHIYVVISHDAGTSFTVSTFENSHDAAKAFKILGILTKNISVKEIETVLEKMENIGSNKWETKNFSDKTEYIISKEELTINNWETFYTVYRTILY